MPTGKVSRTFFEERIAPNLGADRRDVALGPTHGVDFGAVSIGDQVVVTATDPISILPELGWKRAGRFAVRIVLADVAVSGIPPSHLTVSLALPPSMTDEQFSRVWTAIDAECRDLGVAVVTGHTARYEGCTFPWVGAATGMAVGTPGDVVRPDDARPGDELLVTTGPAVEAVGLLTTLFPDAMTLDADRLETAQACLDETDTVRDAVTAAATGDIHAMHDATEGGLLGGFHEVAASSGVRLSIDRERVPWRPGVKAACDALEMDPWRATAAGTLIIAVDPTETERVQSALTDQGTRVGVVGQVESGNGVYLDGNATTPPDGDAAWPVYERLLADNAT